MLTIRQATRRSPVIQLQEPLDRLIGQKPYGCLIEPDRTRVMACIRRRGGSDFRKIPDAPSFMAIAELLASAAAATIKKRP